MKSAATQRKVIAVCAIVTFTLGFLKAANDSELPSAKFLVGIGLAFTVISVISDLGSPLGMAFALIIMLGAILTEFDDVFNLLNARSGGNLSKGSKKGKAGKKKKGTVSGPITVPPKNYALPSPDYPHGSTIPTNDSTVSITYS